MSASAPTGGGSKQASDGGNDDLGTVQDVLGCGTDSRETESGKGEVTAAILQLRRPPRVMPPAVAFDDKPPVHDDIDSAHPRYDDLYLHVPSERPGDQPHESFRARLGATVDVRADETLTLRKRVEQFVELAPANEPEVKCRVDGGDGSARSLTESGLA